MQAIVTPKTTIWASTGHTDIKVSVESGKVGVSKKDAKPGQEGNDQFHDISSNDIEELNMEFAKLNGSKVIKGLAKNQSVSSHRKKKQGLDYIH